MLNVEVDLDKDFISIYVFIAAYFPKGLLFVIPLFYSISVSKFNQFCPSIIRCIILWSV